MTLPDEERMAYAAAEAEERYRLGAPAPTARWTWSSSWSPPTAGEPTLVIGQYLDQLDELAERLGAPLITGKTPVKERQRLYDAFRTGEDPAAGGVQGGQLLHRPARGRGRHPGLGHVRHPPGGGPAAGPDPASQGRRPRAHFYTVVSRDTNDEEFAPHRQRFLAEQGYAYRIVDAEDLGDLRP